MKSREPRRKVLISARMRVGGRWGDVRILNLSRRGMLVQAAETPERGTYLELRRGAHAIIARVAWTAGNRFGAFTQDPLDFEALVSDSAEPEATPSQPDTEAEDRRSALRAQGHSERHERNRWAARAFELACIAGFGFGLALLAGEALQQALAAPLSVTSAALDQR